MFSTIGGVFTSNEPAKIVLVLGIIALFIGMSITLSVAVDNIEQSSIPTSNGKTLYVGGTGGGNYTTIQDAINNSNNGDTVFVFNGTYYENIVVDKSINLIGENRNITIITTSYSYLVIVSADWVNISGFTILSNELHGFRLGIDLRANYTTIKGNAILNFSYGISANGYWYEPSKNNIIGNIISNNEGGISLSDSLSTIISLNTIINNGEGIHLRNSNSNTIIDNNLSSNDWGIIFYESDNNTITKNNVSNNGEGIGFLASNNNTIAYNKINANKYYGLWFKGGKYNIICNNIISKSQDGINLQSDNNMFKNNSISNNECGIDLIVCSSNTIQKNNFLDNELDVNFFSIFIVSLLKRNIWKENYWNRPRILPKIIFGRASLLGRHEFPWINFDWHPAKEPYDIEGVI